MKKITGTYDIYGEYANEFRRLEDYLYSLSEFYNFEYIKTPIIEDSKLYHRELNNTQDNVEKHMYDFIDLAGESITLRPECNSGIARAVIENKIYTQLPRKFYYYGDVFRYDKPQKGRYREFTQFGFELIGSNQNIVDAEMLSLAYNIYKGLGVRNITLKINSLGSIDDLERYRLKLVDYFSKYIDDMCCNCKKRLLNNPLRIFDCKDKYDKEIIEHAPKLLDNLSIYSLKKFQEILRLLDLKNIPYSVDSKFIRGIDYQNDTIFEILNNDGSLGSQNNLCGGGRYDNLYTYLSEKTIPAFGFDFGLERLITSIKNQNPTFFSKKTIDVFIINIGTENLEYCYELCDKLRSNGISTEYNFANKSFKSQFNLSDMYNSQYTIFIGTDECNHDILNVRNNTNGEKNKFLFEDFIKLFNRENESGKVACLKYGSK